MSYEDHLPPHIRKSPPAKHGRQHVKPPKLTRDQIKTLIDEAFEFTMAHPQFRTPKILEGFAEEYRRLGG